MGGSLELLRTRRMNWVRMPRNSLLPPGARDEELTWLRAVGNGSSSDPASGGL